MVEETGTMGLTRRGVLVAGSAGLAAAVLVPPGSAKAGDEAIELIERLIDALVPIRIRENQ